MFASLATVLASLVLSSLACQESSDFTMTFYGYPDNSPPGPQVALSCGGRNGVAGGTGTYADPLTMAAQEGRFTACEVVYSPYLQKYLRLEDTCAACTGDWVDVWTGSTTENGGSALSSCQDSLTGNDAPSRTLLMSPPDNLQVNSGELFSGGTCFLGNVSPTASGSCTGSGSGSAASGAPVAASGAPVPPTVTSYAAAIPSARPTHKTRTRKGRHGHRRM